MRILVIDDEEMICQLAQKILERCGHEVILAESGSEGLRECQDNPNSFDLAIVDYFLGDMTGLTLLEKMRELDPTLPCLLSSGKSPKMSDIPENLRENTFLLDKPYRSSQLREKVAEILGCNA